MVSFDEIINFLDMAFTKLKQVKGLQLKWLNTITDQDNTYYKVIYSAPDKEEEISFTLKPNIDMNNSLIVDDLADIPYDMPRVPKTVLRIAYFLWSAYNESD